MDPDLDQRLKILEEKVDRASRSVEQMRKMYLWTLWIGVALIVIPLIVMAFVLPGFIKSLDLNGLLNANI